MLRFLRTRGHFEPLETAMKAFGRAGEYAAVWAAIGAVGAAVDGGRRERWLAATATGPAAIGVNFLVKVSRSRRPTRRRRWRAPPP